MPEEKGLLEALAKRLGCNYLSDLREREFQSRAIRAALEFSREEYSASQWRDAAGYLLELTHPPRTGEEARELLQIWAAAHFFES
mgnify:CR=1 FL=1